MSGCLSFNSVLHIPVPCEGACPVDAIEETKMALWKLIIKVY